MAMNPEVFLDYGSIGLFLAFMVYQYLAQKKEIKEHTTMFFSQLEKLEDKYDLREQELRKRYDIVIKDYQADLQDAKEERMSLKSNVQEMIKSIDVNQDKIFEIYKEWQQELKLINLSRKLDRK